MVTVQMTLIMIPIKMTIKISMLMIPLLMIIQEKMVMEMQEIKRETILIL